MTDNVQGFGPMQGLQGMMMGGGPKRTPLTDEQKQKVQDILSAYDPENLTADQAKEIFQKFGEAGIQPAQGMKEAIEGAGFDADKLREMGMPKGHHHHPSSDTSQDSSSGINTSALQSLMDILSQYDPNNITSDQQNELLGKLKQAGLLTSGNTVNLSI